MAFRISTALGVVAGLVLSLSLAVIIVIAGNGGNNPGMVQANGESAAGGASAPLLRPSSEHSAFDGLDIDGDGKLSLAEAAGYGDIVARFRRLDRNKDGKLSKTEFDRLAKLPPLKQTAKAKPRLREDAAASLAAAREGQ